MSLEKNDKIVWVEIEKLKPHPKNSNKHPKEQIERLAKILKYQGFRSPIQVSNLSGHVVVGHGRIEAAKKIGLTKVPVSYQDFENEEQEIAHLNADNAIALWAEIDMSTVDEAIKDFSPDFDFDFLGFADFEKKEDSENIGGLTDDDSIPETKENELGVQLGDIYQLGEHRLMCGDSTDEETVSALMNGEKADMVFTDPPFPNNSGIMHEMIIGIEDSFRIALENSKGLNVWFWDNLSFPPFDEPVTAKHIWHKTNGWQAGHFETLYCFHRDKKRHEQIVFSNANVRIEKREDQGNHPTPKPTSLPVDIFEKFNFGKSVLDLFLGSGSTLIACEKTNRKCFGSELDPHYCSVIIKRWQDYTGKKAEKING